MTTSPTSTGPPAAAEPAPPPEQRSGLLRGAREVVVIVVVALVASALLRAFVAQAFVVPTGSMLPEIQLNDKIVVSRIGSVHRGEVVVFEDPGGWITQSEKGAAPGSLHAALQFVGLLPLTRLTSTSSSGSSACPATRSSAARALEGSR